MFDTIHYSINQAVCKYDKMNKIIVIRHNRNRKDNLMKKLLIILLLLLPTTVRAADMRGVWVSVVANLDYPSEPTTDSAELRAQADRILDNCASLNMNAVFLQVRPSCDAIYKSELFPYSAYLTGSQGTAPSDGFDPLAYWIDGAHSRGIELHAWINPYRICTDASAVLSDDNPAVTHPEWVIVYNNAKYFDPGIPEVREYVTEGIREIIAGYDIDGIHFDDYFYPGKDFPDNNSYEKYGGGQSRDDWRRSNTTALVRSVSEEARENGVRFGISPCGIWANKGSMENGSDTHGASAYFDMYADTLGWAKDNIIDYIAPQIYWYNGFEAADYGTLAKWWSDQLRGCKTDLYIGLGDYRIDQFGSDPSSPWFEGNEIIKQINQNRELDTVKGEIHFRYGSIRGPLYDKLRSQYSEPVKEQICVYIYFDKHGKPIFTKKDTQLSRARCREFAPEDSAYCSAVYFENGTPHKKIISSL